jgi:hypothetical protein
LILLFLGVSGCQLDREGTFVGDAPSDASVPDADATVQDGPAETQPEAGPDTAPDAPDGAEDAAQEAGDAWDDAQDATSDADTCAPETDAELCSRLAVECGSFTGEDNCGETRSVTCGGCSAPSTCGGAGTANACDWWWTCEWSHRRRLTVSSQDALPAGYSLSFLLDHASLVDAGLSVESGDDVRIVHLQSGQVVEIDRVLDPDSQWDSGTTRIWFATQTAIPAGGQDDYYLFVGNPVAGAPSADEADVFHFADFFDRPDDEEPGLGWLTWEANGATVGIAERALWLVSSDQNNRPVADHPFPPLSGGVELRFGVDWKRTAAEGWYRLHLQLGNSTAMDNPPPESDVFSNLGTGPSLLWSGTNGGMANHEGFGYEVGGVVTESVVVSGKASIAVRASVPARTFDLFVDGTQVADDAAFSSNQGSLDRLRFFLWQVNSAYVSRTALDWLLLRPLAGTEPTVTAVPFEQGTCP